jgi:hypothetical protein
MRPELDDREWPVPLNLDPRFVGSEAMRDLYQARWEGLVSEGYVMARTLGIRGSGPVIPAGESAITSLCAAGKWVYGATSGRKVHVFAYCALPGSEAVFDLCVLEGCVAAHNSIAWLDGHGLFLGARGADGEGQVFRIGVSALIGSVIQEWNPPAGEATPIALPVPGEGIACMVGDPLRARLYGLSDRTGTLFCVDPTAGDVRVYGHVDELERFAHVLGWGPDACLYGSGTRGRIWRFCPETQMLQDSGLRLPCMAGRGQYSRLGAWALDTRSGTAYAGDVADGLLSALDLSSGRARPIGKPTAQPHIRALAVVPDGRVYGFAGSPGGIGHLFVYEPDTGALRDLGVMASAVDRRWYAYEVDCAVAGPDGRTYFGEAERISHLFVYVPPLCGGVMSDE